MGITTEQQAYLNNLPKEKLDALLKALDDGISELPAVSSSDNGKVLTVDNGEWAVETPPSPSSELPEVTAEDNGDVLTVVEGAWAKSAKDSVVIYGTSSGNGQSVDLDNGVKQKDIYKLVADGVNVSILLHGNNTAYRGRLFFSGEVGTSYVFASIYGASGKLNYAMYEVNNTNGTTLNPTLWKFTPDV